MAQPAPRPITLEEYLVLSAESEEKLEFVNGEIVAMAGAREAHSTVQMNVALALATRLHGKKPCRVHGSDLRVTIDETGLYAYPDITVVCGQPEWAPTRPESLMNPGLLVEVLSESTANYDLGAKTAHYRRRESVEGIVHVDSRARRVDVWTRMGAEEWRVVSYTEGVVSIPGVEGGIPMDEIYEAWHPDAPSEPEAS